MFIDELQTVKIKIYYKKEGHNYLAYSARDMERIHGKPSSETAYIYDDFQELNLDMRELTWGAYNDLQEKALQTQQDGSERFSMKKYKEFRLEHLLIGWDAKRKDRASGELVNVPVNQSTLGALAPEIAETILVAYELEMDIGGEEEKKLEGR